MNMARARGETMSIRDDCAHETIGAGMSVELRSNRRLGGKVNAINPRLPLPPPPPLQEPDFGELWRGQGTTGDGTGEARALWLAGRVRGHQPLEPAMGDRNRGAPKKKDL